MTRSSDFDGRGQARAEPHRRIYAVSCKDLVGPVAAEDDLLLYLREEIGGRYQRGVGERLAQLVEQPLGEGEQIVDARVDDAVLDGADLCGHGARVRALVEGGIVGEAERVGAHAAIVGAGGEHGDDGAVEPAREQRRDRYVGGG